MEPVRYLDREREARRIREEALAQRPSYAPLPAAGGWQVSCEPYWTAVAQFYQAAQQFYRSGDYAQGDYCIAKGDVWRQLALQCMNYTTLGVTPLLEAEPEHPRGATPPTRDQLPAQLEAVRRLRDANAPPPPTVPAEAANDTDCTSYGWMAVAHMLITKDAYAHGNTAEGDYHYDLALAYTALWQACMELSTTLGGS